MGCFLQETEGGGTTRVVMEFSYDELLYDIKNACWMEGRALRRQEEAQAPGTAGGGTIQMSDIVTDIGEDGNRDRVNRMLGLYHSAVTELLYAYTQREVTKSILTDNPEEPAVYHIIMEVPEGFSQTTLDYMERLIHEWLAAKVVTDYLAINLPDQAKLWAGRAEELDTEIRGCVNARRNYGRIKGRPF